MLGVSRSSVSLWVRNIELTEEQRDALRRGNPLVNAQMRGAAANAARWRARRQSYQDEGRALARGGDPFHAAGCMLFWAEGSRQRDVVIFSNSDPRMARFFLEFLRAYFGVSDEAVRVTCHLFADHEERQREIEQFWLDTLRLPPTCLCKSIVNVYSKHSQKKRRNKLPYGTCRLVLHDTRVVQSIYGAIQEYGGFKRDEWLG